MWIKFLVSGANKENKQNDRQIHIWYTLSAPPRRLWRLAPSLDMPQWWIVPLTLSTTRFLKTFFAKAFWNWRWRSWLDVWIFAQTKLYSACRRRWIWRHSTVVRRSTRGSVLGPRSFLHYAEDASDIFINTVYVTTSSLMICRATSGVARGLNQKIILRAYAYTYR